MKPCKIKQPGFLIISLLFLCLHILFLTRQRFRFHQFLSYVTWTQYMDIYGKYRCALEHSSKWVLIEMYTALQCDGSSDDRRHRQKGSKLLMLPPKKRDHYPHEPMNGYLMFKLNRGSSKMQLVNLQLDSHHQDTSLVTTCFCHHLDDETPSRKTGFSECFKSSRFFLLINIYKAKSWKSCVFTLIKNLQKKRLIVYQTSERQDQWEGDLLNEFMQTYAKDAYWVKADLVDKLFWISFSRRKGSTTRWVRWVRQMRSWNEMFQWLKVILPSPVRMISTSVATTSSINFWEFLTLFLYTLFSALLITSLLLLMTFCHGMSCGARFFLAVPKDCKIWQELLAVSKFHDAIG